MIASWLEQHWFAVALAIVYTAFLFAHARLGLRAGKSAADFHRRSPPRRRGHRRSFYATFASTNSYLGFAGKGYEYGLPWLDHGRDAGRLLLAVVALCGTAVRRFAAEWGSLTVPDFLAVRFGSDRVRTAAAAIIVFSCLLYLIAVFKGAGNLLQVFLDIPYQLAVIVTLCLIVMYTMLGGFVSVVRTDVLQGSLMVVGSLLLFYFITSAAGGIGVISELPNEPSRAPPRRVKRCDSIRALDRHCSCGLAEATGRPAQVTRFYGLKDERSVRVGIWVAVIGILVIQFCLFRWACTHTSCLME